MKRIWILLLCALMLTVCLPVSAAEAEGVATTEKMTSLLSCDTVDYWRSEAEISLDTEDKTEGEACVSFAGSVPKDANQTVSIEAVFPSTNITGADALTFDFYISDPTLLRSTYILTVDLASSGGPESEMLDWSGDVLQSITEPGWYHVTLPFEKAINLGFNDTRVNYFRLYLFHIIPEQDIENAVVKIDNVAVRIPEYRTTMVESCDTVDGWTGNHAPYAAAPVLDTAVKKQGSGSLRYTVTLPEEVHLVSQKVYATPINAKGAAYVEMDVYVSDIGVFEDSRYAINFELRQFIFVLFGDEFTIISGPEPANTQLLLQKSVDRVECAARDVAGKIKRSVKSFDGDHFRIAFFQFERIDLLLNRRRSGKGADDDLFGFGFIGTDDRKFRAGNLFQSGLQFGCRIFFGGVGFDRDDDLPVGFPIVKERCGIHSGECQR